MNGRRLAWAGAATALLIGAAWWTRPLLPEVGPLPDAPARTLVVAAPPPATRPVTPVLEPLAAQTLASAVAGRYLAPALPADTARLLAAGDVEGAARALQGSADPNAPAALAGLSDWCLELAVAATDEAPAPAVLAPRLRARFEQLADARRHARARLADGCASARLDATAIAERLRASALAGNGASLERAVLDGLLPPARLGAAAVLGAPRAGYLLALELWGSHPEDARGWLATVAPRDAEAAAYLAACRLAGCGGPADAAGGQHALEAAARRGSNWALGLLASPGAGREPYRWLAAATTVSPLPPTEATLPLSAAERYGWARLAAGLAQDGCFGFDLGAAGEALGAAERVGELLSPAALDAAGLRAGALAADAGAETRAARGCR